MSKRNPNPNQQQMKLNERELATVLAGLRLFQQQRGGFSHPEWMEHFNDCEPLNDRQIDNLCERINR